MTTSMTKGMKRIGAMSLAAFAGLAGQATAQDIQMWRLTFTIEEGPFTGQEFFGTLSYDQSVLEANFTDGILFADFDPGLSEFDFNVSLFGGSLSIADDPGAIAFFGGNDLIGLNFLGDNFTQSLITLDLVDEITNTFQVFVDPDFIPDGFGSFTFERITPTDIVTRAFDSTNTDIDDTDILSTPTTPADTAEDTNFNGSIQVSVDADDGPGSFNPRQVLIRFNDIIGTGPNQVPPGSTIIGAVFRVEIISPGSGFTAHRLLVDWNPDTVTWNTFVGGVSADDIEAASFPDSSLTGVGLGVFSVDLTSSLQAFVDGAPNFGFVLLPVVDGTDGIDFFTSEAPTLLPQIFFPPRLTVELSDGRTLTFQENVGGYAGTADNTLREEEPDNNFGGLNTTSIDLSDGGFQSQYTLRFDGIFGNGPDQINPGDSVISATIRVRSTSAGEDVGVYELASLPGGAPAIVETEDTWNSFGGGLFPVQQIETFLTTSIDPTAGFSGGGAVVTNPGAGDFDNQFGGSSTGEGWLSISNPSGGSFAVRSLEPSIVAYNQFETIQFALIDSGAPDSLEIRVAVGNTGNFWVSNAGFVPTPEWTLASVDLTDASQWTQVIGTGTFADALANADRLMFRHETLPINDGQSADSATGDFGIDFLTFSSEGELRAPAVTVANTQFNTDNPDFSMESDNSAFFDFDVTSSLRKFAAAPATNEGWAFLPFSTNGFDFDAEGALEDINGPQLFVSFIPPVTGCNPADLSDTPPGSGTFGQLDGNDIGAFISGFLGNDPVSDLSDTPPGSGTFGQFDGNDIGAFISAFLAGCPTS